VLLRSALPHLEPTVTATDEMLEKIAAASNGDVRSAYNTLEVAAAGSPGGAIQDQALTDALGRKVLLYDKTGEEHYNVISALHKSVRSSDPDAALYWLARMLEAGEDRMYIARRVVRMAIEDIGLADPRALEQCIAMQQAVHFLGIPEGDLALAQAVIYLAVAPKSDAGYRALGDVSREVREGRAEPVPMQLRNAPTKSMKPGVTAKAISTPMHLKTQSTKCSACPIRSPDAAGITRPERGVEKRIKERLEELRARKKATPPTAC